ncbi:hypothetical protein Xph01_57770 [Micromonospora phaseoli]|nr:hypothetical protein Xph01_57770 [Micromonospora phaseoli]
MIPIVSTSPATARKRPTIRDVAREAGVSYATVSRVLNSREWVSPAAVRAVREAIARTGYTVRLLTDVIAGRSPLSITVPTRLVIRASSPAPA